MLQATAGVTVVRRATMELQKDEQTSAVAPATIADWAAMVRAPPSPSRPLDPCSEPETAFTVEAPSERSVSRK
jgi:hypothetical protein